ncbi:MAG: hypothetical protein V1846_01255 [Candidatus Komeilibacteria bacterium]
MLNYTISYLKEVKVKQVHSWGVSYNKAIPHSGDLGCPVCGWESPSGGIDLTEMAAYLVGFDTELSGLSQDEECMGGFIFECPHCFERFWFHAADCSIDLLIFIDAWPK